MKAILTLALLLITSAAPAQVTNLRDGVWSDRTIWSDNLIPGDTTDIKLSYNVVVDVTAVCRSLNTNGHNITVNTGVTLNVVGDSTFTDPRDGQVYRFKKIGTQVWMTQNLNYYALNSACCDDDPANCAIYGRLYTWADALVVAPPGWHLPSRSEWAKLVGFLGGDAVAASKMKEPGTAHWAAPNADATNSSGFTALPGGFHFYNLGPHESPGLDCFWWSSDALNTGYAWECFLLAQISTVYIDFSNNGFYYSVRCIRD